MTDSLSWLLERVRAAAATGTPLQLRGGGTKDFYGEAPQGELLDTRAHAGIVNYEPSELVLTARCGTPLAEIEKLLAENGQLLAFEPPHFGAGATLGGCVSAGLSGPRRASSGAVRDFVLGIQMIDGRGQLLSFGGEVMKNVAGYDVSRLVCGALGTLGLVTQISLKVLPRPVAEATLRFEFDTASALDHLHDWGRQALPLSASACSNGTLMLRLAGAASAVQSARTKLGGELIDPEDADIFWSGVREHTARFFSEGLVEQPLWRLSVAATAPAIQLPGEQMIEWHGALRWFRTSADAAQVRAAVANGHATLFRSSVRTNDVFTALPPVLKQLHVRLKASLDPKRIFNPGRLYRDL